MIHDEAKSITQTFQRHAFFKSGQTSVGDLKVIHPCCALFKHLLLKHSPTKHLNIQTPPTKEFKHPGCPIKHIDENMKKKCVKSTIRANDTISSVYNIQGLSHSTCQCILT
jgi:hypothetical protein